MSNPSIDPETISRKFFPDDARLEELARCVLRNEPSGIRTLKQAGTDLGHSGRDGITLLQTAILAKVRDAFLVLLQLGADVNQVGINGTFPIHTSTEIEDDWFLDVLLDAGAGINSLDTRQGATPLMYSMTDGTDQGFMALLRRGADINIVSPVTGKNALLLAGLLDNPAHALILLKRGAAPDFKSRQGATFQEYMFMADILSFGPLKQEKYREVLLWLMEHEVPMCPAAAEYRDQFGLRH